MKISLFQLSLAIVFAGVSLAGDVTAQELLNRRVSLRLDNQNLVTALATIEKQADVRFTYRPKLFTSNQRVSLTATNESLSQVLDRILVPLQVKYRVISNQIILSPIKGTVAGEQTGQLTPNAETPADPQDQTISGKVTDETGNGMPGVSIVLKGTQRGTTSNTDGNYSIAVPDGNATLVFSFVGYMSREEVVGNRSSVNVALAVDNKSLSEVVVVGYGTQSKRDVTGAISVIDVAQTKDIPLTNVSRLILGQAAGVAVTQPTGRPGTEFQVLVRGIGSLGAGSEPLYVIDGFPVGTSVGQNLNPADIESISILKDAVSTAIYGARGSNGVVLITTKNAKEGKLSLNVTANYGFQNIPSSRKVKTLNGRDFAQFKRDGFVDRIRFFEKREPAESEIPSDFRFPDQTQVSTNWYDAVLNDNAPFQNYNITLSQGTNKFRTLVSLGLMDQQGALIKTGYKNKSLRTNISGKINDFVEVGLNLNGSYSQQKLAPSTESWVSMLGSTLLMDPRKPIYNPDGSYYSYVVGEGMFGWGNPVQVLNEVDTRLDIANVLSNGYLEFSLLKGLKFKTVANVKLDFQAYKQFTPSTVSGIFAPAPRNASLNQYNDKGVNYSLDQLLTYKNEFGDHSLDALVGFNAQEETVQRIAGNGNTFSSDQTPYFGTASNRDISSGEFSWSALAYFGRANYSFKNKYLLTATFRREGNSRFGLNNKFGNFPALSAGWHLSEEKFMSGLSMVNDLKLRASWGVTGNSNIGNYPSRAYMNTNGYIIGNGFLSGQVVGSFANPNLQWEKSRQTNIGLDLVAFNNKLTFSADYYKRLTNDMLLPVQLPAISGFTTTFTNIGKVQNSGIELLLGYKTKLNRAVDVFGNFNISFNRNKVLEIRGENDEIRTGDFYDGYNVSRVGRPIGMIHGFQVVKLFNNQDEISKAPKQDGAIPGVNQYLDANGDGEISYDTKDMVEIGNPLPKFTLGLTTGAKYKNFDLSILFNGSYGNSIYRRIETSTMNMDGVFNVLEESKDRWRSESNPGNGKYTTTNTWKWERESSSRYIYDGSHLWVRNLTLGYTVPQTKFKHAGLRLYATSDNLFLFTKYPGNNPDINNRGGISPGIDDEAYPVARTFSFGLNLNF